MKKQINIVYVDHHGDSALYYDGDDGTILMSNRRNVSMPNVFFGDCNDVQSDDSIMVLEPIVTTPSHYNIQYLSKFRYVFAWASKFFETTEIKDKLIEINCGSELCSPKILPRDKIGSWDIPWKDKIDGAVVISCNKQSQHQASIYPLREKLADALFESRYHVDWYGHQQIRKPYYRCSVGDKLSTISKYKFHICTENTYDPIFSYNYLTEKLTHCIFAGSVPLYMGAYNIDDLLPNKDSFLDLRNFVIKKDGQITVLRQPLMERIRSFSEADFKRYIDATRQTLTDPRGILHHTDMDRCCKKMLEVI